MPIDHPEVLVICMSIVLLTILITAYVAIKHWAPKELEDKKH